MKLKTAIYYHFKNDKITQENANKLVYQILFICVMLVFFFLFKGKINEQTWIGFKEVFV